MFDTLWMVKSVPAEVLFLMDKLDDTRDMDICTLAEMLDVAIISLRSSDSKLDSGSDPDLVAVGDEILFLNTLDNNNNNYVDFYIDKSGATGHITFDFNALSNMHEFNVKMSAGDSNISYAKNKGDVVLETI